MSTTVADLEALPVGTRIFTVTAGARRREWNRTEDGWVAEGGTPVVETHLFLGPLNRGEVTLVSPNPAQGEWWQARSHWYFCYASNETQADYLRFRRNRPDEITMRTVAHDWMLTEPQVRLESMPSQVGAQVVVEALAIALRAQTHTAEQSMAAQATAVAEVRALKNRPDPEQIGLAAQRAASEVQMVMARFTDQIRNTVHPS